MSKNPPKKTNASAQRGQRRGVKWHENGSQHVEVSRTPEVSELGEQDYHHVR